MAQKNIILWVVVGVVVLLAIFGIFYFAGNGKDSSGGSDSGSADADVQKFQELQRDSEGNVIIEIRDFVFNPAEVTIYPRQGIKWINYDDTTHQVYGVVGEGGEIRSQKLNKGSYYTYVFEKSGIYEYHCTYHPDMKGKIIVK